MILIISSIKVLDHSFPESFVLVPTVTQVNSVNLGLIVRVNPKGMQVITNFYRSL